MKKKSILLLETIIWIIVLGGLITLGINILKHDLTHRQSYQVIFKDVDGLMIGAPVRIMGIQVGHVTEVNPVQDQVFVTFNVTNKNVSLPKGSTISLQFTGLAGSKSLEIEPPESPESGSQFVEVIEPIRISNLMEVQAKISESILDSSKNTLDFFGKGKLETMKKNIKYSTVVTDDAIHNFDDAGIALHNADSIISKGIKGSRTFLTEQNNNITATFEQFSNSSINEKTRKSAELASNFTQKVEYELNNSINRNYASKTANNLKNFNKKVSTVNDKMQQLKEEKPDFLNQIHTNINNSLNTFKEMLNFIGKNMNRQNVEKIQNQCKKMKNSAECIEKKI